MSSGIIRQTRLNDLNNASRRVNGDDGRPGQANALGQGYANAGANWTKGIWGTSALGSTFNSASIDPPRTKAEDRPYSHTANSSFEGKSGSSSLVAESESESWPKRQPTPWNSGGSISPALSNAPLHDTGASPARPRNILHQTGPSLTEKPRSTSPYFPPLRGPIGQAPTSAGRSGQPAFVEPTSNPFNANMVVDEAAARHGAGLFDSFTEPDFDPAGHGPGPASDARPGSSATTATSDSASSRRADQAGFSQSAFRATPPGRASPYQQGRPTSRGFAHSASSSGASPFPAAFSHPAANLGQDPRSGQLEANLARMNLHDMAAPPRQAHGLATSMAGYAGKTSTPGSYDYRYRHPATAAAAASTWAPAVADTGYVNGVGQFPSESLVEAPFVEQIGSFRMPRSNEVRSISPATHDFRHRQQSPYYSAGGTPSGLDHHRVPSRGTAGARPGSSGGHSALLEQKLRGLQLEQQGYLPQSVNATVAPDVFRGAGNAGAAFDFNPQAGYRAHAMLPYLPAQALPPRPGPPRGPSREQDLGSNHRSALLEEFRSNAKTSKRYDLKDIYDHVVEFSGDQHGSRFIQQKLETANSDEKEQVFRELRPNSLQLMADVFGNYVIQKFFEHGTQQQKTVLADQMKGHILNLSLQMYGCRVVQKALEHILVDQQAALVKELDVHVLKCVKDQNGNHVIQKAIERVPPEHIQFIINAFTGQVQSLATHQYGCRVVQRMLEHCEGPARSAILQELHACTYALIVDQYGNYVTQHVIEHGREEDRSKIIELVTGRLVHFSKHKFASNVVEKSIQFGSDDQRRSMMSILTAAAANGSSPVQSLMRDQYGNYVIQKLLGQLKGADFDQLADCIKPQLPALKKFAYGKQISAIEKIILSATPSSAQSPPTTSAAPTPPLSTTEAQSPQSSSLPSTSHSTIDCAGEHDHAAKAISGDDPSVALTAVASS